MPTYSRSSSEKLFTCHDSLQEIFNTAIIQGPDHTILRGHRNQEEQDTAYFQKKSKLKFPHSKHNKLPSLAVDAVPYPIIWPTIDLVALHEIRFMVTRRKMLDKYVFEIARFYTLAGYIIAIGHKLGYNIRWGGDWNQNWLYSDQDFNDLVHYELVL